ARLLLVAALLAAPVACEGIAGVRELAQVTLVADAAPPDGALTDHRAPTDAGPCGDIRTDSNNCGECGHSCRGAPCNGGICAPKLQAHDDAGAQGLTADPTFLYWFNTDTNVVRSVRKDSPLLATTTELSPSRPTAIAAHPGLYFTETDPSIPSHPGTIK